MKIKFIDELKQGINRMKNNKIFAAMTAAVVITAIILIVAFDSSCILEYKFGCDKNGCACGSVFLTPETGGKYTLYWGSDGNKLEGFESLTTVNAAADTAFEIKIIDHTVIPNGADELLAYRNDKVVSQYEIPENRIFSHGKTQYSFGALSDVHMGSRYDEEMEIPSKSFSNALDKLTEKGTSLIAISGDIGNKGLEIEYLRYADSLNEFRQKSDVPVYTCTGNHDCYGDGMAMFEKYVQDKSDTTRIYVNQTDFYVSVGDDIFYFLSQRYAGYNSVDSKLLDNTQLDTLESVLSQHSGRVFLFFHTFINGESGDATNGIYAYPLAYTDGTDDCERFKEILRKNKNIIFFSGHSHWEFDMQNRYDYTKNAYSNNDANISNGGGEYCTLIHIPSCTSPRTIYGRDPDRTELYSVKSEGYIGHVYADCVVLYGMDLITGNILPSFSYVIF